MRGDLRFVTLALGSALLATGCSYHVRVGEHGDAGAPGECTSEAQCAAGNQCVCGHCISLDLPAPACDPPCESAIEGDYCHDEGNRCDAGACSQMVCSGGVYRRESGMCDAGMCECPAPPTGCHYVGDPCPCSAIVCEPVRCGRTLCSMGTECCNASCGVCVEPGGMCADVVCPPDCSPLDAVGSGACDASLGYAWNGSECVDVRGCSCAGADCPILFASSDECYATFSGCARTCGGFGGLTCDPALEWCDYGPDPSWCGGVDDAGICRPRPTECPPVVGAVCGCDGLTYPSACDASMYGTDVAHDGACGDCEPDDARSIGLCGSIFGYAWTAAGCAPITCSCEGADCMIVASRDEETCRRAHAECAIPAVP